MSNNTLKQASKTLRQTIETIELTPEQGEAMVEYITDYLNKWKNDVETKLTQDYLNRVGAQTHGFVRIGDKDDSIMFRMNDVFYIVGDNDQTTVVFKNENADSENIETVVAYPIQKSLDQLQPKEKK